MPKVKAENRGRQPPTTQPYPNPSGSSASSSASTNTIASARNGASTRANPRNQVSTSASMNARANTVTSPSVRLNQTNTRPTNASANPRTAPSSNPTRIMAIISTRSNTNTSASISASSSAIHQASTSGSPSIRHQPGTSATISIRPSPNASASAIHQAGTSATISIRPIPNATSANAIAIHQASTSANTNARASNNGSPSTRHQPGTSASTSIRPSSNANPNASTSASTSANTSTRASNSGSSSTIHQASTSHPASTIAGPSGDASAMMNTNHTQTNGSGTSTPSRSGSDVGSLPRSIECPICANILRVPKVLSCFHTFCESCLSMLHRSRGQRRSLSCPLCRQATPLRDGLVSSLGTNLVVQALAEELPSEAKTCTICKLSENEATSFCSHCEDYLCEGCFDKHNAWEKFSRHEVYSMEDVKAGKVQMKRVIMCGRHKEKESEFFCRECHTYACIVCRVHRHRDHDIVENDEYERSRKEKVTKLLGCVDETRNALRSFKDFIDRQQNMSESGMQQTLQQINAARMSAVEKINKRCTELSDECKRHHAGVAKAQKMIGSESNFLSARVESAAELIGKGMKSHLHGDAVLAHNTFSGEVRSLIDSCRVNVNYVKIWDLTKSAVGYGFKNTRQGRTTHHLCSCHLGTLSQYAEWMVRHSIEVPDRQATNRTSLAISPDGQVLVGNSEGSIDVCTSDIFRQRTMLADEKVKRLEVLSDGKIFVCNEVNSLALFSPQGEKLDVKFVMQELYDIGDIAVDSADRIYVSYVRPKMVCVFPSTGGYPTRRILFNNHEPAGMLALRSDWILMHNFRTLSVINEEGQIKGSMISNNVRDSLMYPALSHSGSILIARVKHVQGLVSVDEYTTLLRHIKNIFTDVKVPGLSENDSRCFNFRELPNGDYVMSSARRLFLLFKGPESPDNDDDM